MEKVFTQDGGKYVRRGKVIKDRFNVIDSKEFDNPTFQDFLPHIKLLNLGGEHFGVDTTSSSVDMLSSPDTSWTEKKRAQQIYCEEIEGELVSAFPGQSAAEKKMKADILQVVFDSRSWSKIQAFAPDTLSKGVTSVRQLCQIVKNNEIPEGDTVAWLRGELLRLDSAVDPQDDIPGFKPPAKEETKQANGN